MAEGGGIGVRRNLRVRLGDDLRPQILTLRLAAGVFDPTGGQMVSALYAAETDTVPLTGLSLTVARLANGAGGEPRYRLDLPRAAIQQLYAAASTAPVSTTARVTNARTARVAAWTCGWQAPDGTRATLLYGLLSIFQGGTGA